MLDTSEHGTFLRALVVLFRVPNGSLHSISFSFAAHAIVSPHFLIVKLAEERQAMQSILQYRRFRKHLEDQIQRHGIDHVASCVTTQTATGRDHIPRDQIPEANQLQNEIPRGSRERNGGECTNEKRDKVESDPQQKASENGAMKQPQPKDILSPLDDVHDVPLHDTLTRFDPPESDHMSAIPDGEDLSRSTTNDTASVSSLDTTPEQQQHILETAPTQESTGTALGLSLTGVNVRSRATNEGGHEKGQLFVVGYQGDDDPLNPHNWSIRKRLMITIFIAFIGLIVGFASSIDSAALVQATKDFGVSQVVESLATGMYLVGFGCGAFFAAPISETIGRNPVYLGTLGLFMIFVMASGLAPNIGAQLVFRFLAGFFGSTPLTCAGGSISDMWTASERTAIFPIFANSAFWGPVLGKKSFPMAVDIV